MLQDRIKKIKEYFKGIEMLNGLFIVKVQYGERWGAYNSEDQRIRAAKSEEVADEWFYYADSEEVDIEEIFNLIEETIEMNLSVGAKIELLSKKIEELKLLFSDTPLQQLETLQFVMTNPKKEKRKYNKKKKTVKEENKVEETVVENNIENIEE